MLGSFLDRMVPPGNFIVVASVSNNGHLFNKFFPRVEYDDAANFCLRMSHKGRDTWYAPASYRDATLQTDDHTGLASYRGSRKQINVENLKSFWFDADISRPGDGKDPAKVFADTNEVVQWVKDFHQQTGIPLPNVWVRSGYGVHLYWTFIDAILKDEWQPYANGLKQAFTTYSARGDLSVVADAARILRPIDTNNYKVPASPAPCMMLIDRPDYANSDLLDLIPLSTTGSTKSKSRVMPVAGSMAANAKAGLYGPPRDFAAINKGCAQVSRSLSEGGANDGRQLWRALLTLAYFCEDGRVWAHMIGENHPKYDADDTNNEFDLIDHEYHAKGFGAPLCKTLDAERKGVCDGCALHGQGKSPYSMGVGTVQPDDLPEGFRRGPRGIECYWDKSWRRMLDGNVSDPYLEDIGSEFRLSFTFTDTDKSIRRVAVTRSDLNSTVVRVNLAKQGMQINAVNHGHVTRLIMAWIDQLVAACQVRTTLPSFGWIHAGQYDGLAIGGEFYNADGAVHEAFTSDDRHLVAKYKPIGTLDAWRSAAQFVIGKVPELHLGLALSFGAPLMELAGETGGCFAFTGPSGVGKSSVFKAGAAVWGNPITSMMQFKDTENYRFQVVGQTQVLPLYWDEAFVNSKDAFEKIYSMLHTLTGGRDKGRLTADISTREHGTWQTIYALATNISVTDMIVAQETHRSATLLRVLEVELDHILPLVADASSQVAALQHNYGHAGRVFAAYLASHQPETRVMLSKANDIVIRQLGSATTEERFYLGIARATIAGAAIAQKLNLVDFDIPGIVKVLVRIMQEARVQRSEIEPTSINSLRDILDDFLNAHSDGILITGEFKKPGPVAQNPSLMQYPRPTGLPRPTPCVHVAVEQGLMRIDKKVMRNWLTHEGKPVRITFKEMTLRWKAKGATGLVFKSRLGHGERWNTPGNIKIVELNLDQGDLRDLIDHYAKPAQAPTTGSTAANVVKLPPRLRRPPTRPIP